MTFTLDKNTQQCLDVAEVLAESIGYDLVTYLSINSSMRRLKNLVRSMPDANPSFKVHNTPNVHSELYFLVFWDSRADCIKISIHRERDNASLFTVASIGLAIDVMAELRAFMFVTHNECDLRLCTLGGYVAEHVKPAKKKNYAQASSVDTTKVFGYLLPYDESSTRYWRDLAQVKMQDLAYLYAKTPYATTKNSHASAITATGEAMHDLWRDLLKERKVVKDA